MTNLAGRLTLTQQKIAAIIFCILAAGCCISLATKGLAPTVENALKPVKSISAPVGVNIKVKEVPHLEGKEKVIRLRKYLDSLRNDPRGRLQYDSLRMLRPGLLDTLEILEQYYKSE